MRATTPVFEIAAAFAFVLSSATSCFALAAMFLRFAGKPSPPFASLSENAYGIYLVHYAFAIWLQYALLGVALVAVAKGAIVFAGTLLLSWAAAIGLSLVPVGGRLIRAERRTLARAP
jgi:surface polysaccharide O-acyltransferase-like enzyme